MPSSTLGVATLRHFVLCFLRELICGRSFWKVSFWLTRLVLHGRCEVQNITCSSSVPLSQNPFPTSVGMAGWWRGVGVRKTGDRGSGGGAGGCPLSGLRPPRSSGPDGSKGPRGLTPLTGSQELLP